ncbi:MAG: hypothetical protein HFI45_14705 [Lachnospiraceae bacterium]|nr:hypothetical protein [Lachnospiraceae bacterium]
MVSLTKDADLLVCCIYKEYLSRRKSGISKDDASLFENDISTISDRISSWSKEDISDTLSELKEIAFVKIYIDGSFKITKELVIYMENRFKNGLTEVIEFISKFIP